MSHVVPSSYFSLFSLLLLTALQSLLLIDQNPCLSTILPPVYIHTDLSNYYDLKIIEICFFLTIPAAKTLVCTSHWLPWYFYLDFGHPTPPPFFFYHVFQNSSRGHPFQLYQHNYLLTSFHSYLIKVRHYYLQSSNLSFDFICFQSILLPKSLLQSSQLLWFPELTLSLALLSFIP